MQPRASSLACAVVVVIVASACGPSPDLGPAVTCGDVSVTNTSGECDLVANQQCSDGSFYEIDCQDDSTCTCVENGSQIMSFLAGSGSSGFCATLTASQLHSLGENCPVPNTTEVWNINP